MMKPVKFGMMALAAITLAGCERMESPGRVEAPGTAVDEEALFHQAVSYGDLGSAAVAAHRLSFQQPDEARRWKEELAKIYFTGGNHEACLRVCSDLATNHGGIEKLGLQELQALALEGAGRREDARKSWNALFDISGHPIHAVRLAGLQFEAGDLEEAKQTVWRGLVSPDAENAMLSLPRSPDQMQDVPAAAALHNLRGLIAMKEPTPDRAEARKCFQNALALLPDFELAKRNLAGVASEE